VGKVAAEVVKGEMEAAVADKVEEAARAHADRSVG
jgi:hypothetical protein